MFALFFYCCKLDPFRGKDLISVQFFGKKEDVLMGVPGLIYGASILGDFFLYFVEILWLSGVSDISIGNYIFLALM